MVTHDKSETPYRTNAQIAEEIPPMPKKPKPFPHWTWKLAILLSEPVAIGVTSDVYNLYPSHHGLIGGAGVAYGFLGFIALYCLVEGVP